jgi:hypothetical protein
MNTPDGYLHRAQAALSCLGHLACFYEDGADTLPADFGFGLSVILSDIEDDVKNAYNQLTNGGDNEG